MSLIWKHFPFPFLPTFMFANITVFKKAPQNTRALPVTLEDCFELATDGDKGTKQDNLRLLF